MYLFTESTKSIVPLCQLANDGTHFSWLAVGTNVVYWGTHEVNPANPSTYTEHQTLYDCRTGKAENISLGKWTTTVYPHDDTLVFQVGQTPSWEQFTPKVQ
ncbi:hypothetical protein [Alicyclobacillus dauci]|uniref:Uncharacterized protein n=1 Tax=Alicyclobacillus dauci TaxID=1475485 RepID=A0ABY6Z0S1_9BACL|nr:hypothetical protein [Alicyclobacillus dauci]WAH35831.1 hypothetical protein NZD86_16370 [Alicyclobacillus dauci]